MGMRRKGRELAVQGLYQIDMRKESPVALENFWRQADAGDLAKEFGRSLVKGVAEHREEIDDLIMASAKNWRIDRLSAVDLSVLRIATCELLYHPDTPTSVALDEAIEIARRFSTGESASFVNGVLDQIAARLGVKENQPPKADDDE